MSTVAADPAVDARSTTALDRLVAALPLAMAFTWLTLIYAWQAWAVSTPWLFTDELEHAQLSRAIAETGQPARRGEPYSVGSVMNVLTAPAWRIDDTETAYDTAKFVGVLLMTSVLFPTYALARLLVRPWPALFAAVGAAAIPAFMYAGLLLEEPLAYPYATLCLYLFARALARREPRVVVLAALAALVAPMVRGQLAVLIPIGLACVVAELWRSGRMSRWRATWSRGDRIGLAVLLLGLAIFANEYASHRSVEWQLTTRHFKDRLLDHGLWAGGALAIGVGVLPVIAGVAALVPPRGERWTEARRAFTLVLASSLVAFSVYTAVKGAYLSATLFTRVAERNLIYLAPLLFVGTALWLERRRLHPWALLGAAALALLLVTSTEVQLEYPYFEAPGFSILALANRTWDWPLETIRSALPWLVLAAVALLVLPSLLRRVPRLAAGTAAAAAVLVLAWTFTGEVAAADGSRETADLLRGNVGGPVDWVDRRTQGEPALYLGQNLRAGDPLGIHLLEFWNRSLEEVWSLDGTAPGPGPTLTPDLLGRDGRLAPDAGYDWIVADAGVELVGRVVQQVGVLRLYRVEHPLRLAFSVAGVLGDGWMGRESSYSRYSTPGGRPGTISVHVSRAGGGDPERPGRVRVRVGTLRLDRHLQPRLDVVTERSTVLLPIGAQETVRLPTPPPPFRVEVTVTPTFVPAEVNPESGDRRELGAKIDYAFE